MSECIGTHCRVQVRRGLLAKPNDALPPHTCPYNEEINEDSETLCTCCEACMRECADDI